MPHLIWSPSARYDVQRAYLFLAVKNRDMAKQAVKVIHSTLNYLARYPEIGRPAEGMAPEYREKIIEFGDSGYVARYRYDRETVVILAVRHQKEAGYL